MNTKLSRILVLLFAILTPIYILVVFFIFDFQLAWLPSDWGYNSQIVYISANWIAPIIFCIGWLYFLFLTGKRLSSTIELMGETSSSISAHYIIFYGICALVMLVSFLIPLFTPIVGILAFSSLIFTLLTSKVNWDDLDEKTKKFVKFFTFFVNIPIIFCSILVVPELIGFSVDIFLEFWNNYLEYLYYLMKGLGVALPIGNFWVLYRNAVSESDGSRRITAKSNTDIIFVEMVITAFLFLLEFYNIEFVEILYYSGMVFWILSFIANFVQGRNAGNSASSKKKSQSPLSLIMFGVFWVATTIFGNDRFAFSDVLRKIIVGGAAFVFAVVFLLVFIAHPDIED